LHDIKFVLPTAQEAGIKVEEEKKEAKYNIKTLKDFLW
jgi:hypothetical protein